MKKLLVSVLLPAHNEEKIIEEPLKRLQKIRREEYKNLEVIVGLDGCTDGTEKVVKKFPFAKIYKSKKRSGKHLMLKKLYKIARGEIIIIHDADWVLVTNNNFKNLIKYFEDKRVGGVEDSPTVKLKENDPILAFGNNFIIKWLHEYKVKKQTQTIDGKLYVKSSRFPFFVNIFRKSALKQTQVTLCDDGERTIQIMKNGYLVAVPPEDDVPFFSIRFSKLSFGTFYRHKIRGYIAKKQVQKHYKEYNASVSNFYLPSFLYVIKQLAKVVLGVLFYLFIAGIASISARTKKFSTKEGWKIRMKR
ncbi:MAG: glycosyltransferase [Candidatus Aenigmatarchaeota archaeon]